jgi:hypothetical protein
MSLAWRKFFSAMILVAHFRKNPAKSSSIRFPLDFRMAICASFVGGVNQGFDQVEIGLFFAFHCTTHVWDIVHFLRGKNQGFLHNTFTQIL